mmetsp:Transcript_9277/g.29510  ORF Transcript_9277/g.29510 Transcript_9277/m.29510 type:complete len:93 (+) Transcript_9277:708-986(+)
MTRRTCTERPWHGRSMSSASELLSRDGPLGADFNLHCQALCTEESASAALLALPVSSGSLGQVLQCNDAFEENILGTDHCILRKHWAMKQCI